MATLVDVWKCPICQADARPPMLFIDGWMLQVRNELVARGESGAKHIMVSLDGKWTVKKENDTVREESSNPSRFSEGNDRKPNTQDDGDKIPDRPREKVVISLLDDD